MKRIAFLSELSAALPTVLNRFIMPTLVAALAVASLVALPHASAQDAEVQIVAIDGNANQAVLSPVEPLAATFANSQLLEDVVEPDYLPIHLIDLTTGEELGTFEGHTDYARGAAFTPDGAQLVTIHGNGELYLWDVGSQTLAKTIRVDVINGVRSLDVFPDGRHLAMTDYGPFPAIEIWDLETGAMTQLLTLPFRSFDDYRTTLEARQQLPDPAVALAVSADGNRVFASTGKNDVLVWEYPAGTVSTLVGSDGRYLQLSIRRLDVLPGDDRLAYLMQFGDPAIHVVDIATGERAETLVDEDNGAAFAVSPDGAMAAWIGRRATSVVVAPLDDLSATTTIDLGWEGPFQPELAFTPDGTRLVVSGIKAGSEDGSAEIAIVTLP